jgi:hypothetical protein
MATRGEPSFPQEELMRAILALPLVAALAFPVAAQAHDVSVNVSPGSFEVSVQDGRYRRPEVIERERIVTRTVTHHPGGHYEQQLVSVWVPATTVEEHHRGECRRDKCHGRGQHKKRCNDGWTETRVIPGHHEQVAQWVWIEDAPPPMSHVAVYRR